MTDTDVSGSDAARLAARCKRSAFGRWMFARTVSKRAPYFGTIKPRFLDLQPKLCRVSMRKRRAVENHIRTVHALAMGNLCELAAGLCTEVTIPVGMRWIPRGMTIEYLAKADHRRRRHRAARQDRMGRRREHRGAGDGHRCRGQEVVRAVISMYVSPRKPD